MGKTMVLWKADSLFRFGIDDTWERPKGKGKK